MDELFILLRSRRPRWLRRHLSLPDGYGLVAATLDGAPIRDLNATVIALSPSSGRRADTVGIFGPNSFTGELRYLDLGNGPIVTKDKRPEAISTGRAYPYRPGHRLQAQAEAADGATG
jgi:hypothetical protein